MIARIHSHMSHFISKIASKIFLFFMGTVLCLSAYFITTAYFKGIERGEQAEIERLESIAKTFSLAVQWPIEREATPLRASAELQDEFRSRIVHMIDNVNRTNGLDPGLHVALYFIKSDSWEIISADGNPTEVQKEHIYNGLIATDHSNPEAQRSIGLAEGEVFYATPLQLNQFPEVQGYIYIQGDTSLQEAKAKELILQRVAIFSLVILGIAILGYRTLRKIFAHEVKSRNKLIEYARLADERNAELETLSFVLERSENLILLADSKGRIEWLNKGEQRKNNYSREELDEFIGRELAEVSQYPKIQEVIDKVVSTKEKYVYEAKSFDENKREFWASTTVTPILDENGEVSKLLFIDADITKLKIAEREISKLAQFPKEFTKPVMRFGADGLVMYANDAGKELITKWGGQLNSHLRNKNVLKILSEVRADGRDKDVNIELENRIYRLHLHPVMNEDYVNVYAEDITEAHGDQSDYRAKALQLEQHNLNITDSINYARRIQSAIIPGEDEVRRYFKDSFVMSKPKDIVSGDFIWLKEAVPNEEYLVALADCTGHGVPGAMMSIVGHSLLNEIVENENITDPATILERLNTEIIRSLRQKTNADSSDGMDVSITKINVKTRTVVFAGAYQPIYWINGKLNVLKGDRQPIGGLHHDTNRKFTNHEFKFSKGDALYFASDGFADQFGGEEDKKFLSRRLVELLHRNHRYSMQAQSTIYKNAFESWRKGRDQVDDVSLMGIKF